MEAESSANAVQGQDVSISIQLVWAILAEHLHEEWVGTKCILGALYIHC